MALILKDRIRETTSTSGTATYELGGATTGFESFSEIGTGNTTYYCCTDGTSFEIGIGTFTDASPDTLARTTILQAKDVPNATTDVAVNWADTSAKDIFCTMPSDKLIFKDENNDSVIKAPDGAIITLQTSDTTVQAGNSLGEIHFQAPVEASGTPENKVTGKIIHKARDDYNYGDAFGGYPYDLVISQFVFQTLYSFATDGTNSSAVAEDRLTVDYQGIYVDGKAETTGDLITQANIKLSGDGLHYIEWEGTDDSKETRLYAKDATVDNSIYLPNKGGELLVMDENTDLSTPVPIIQTVSGTQGNIRINGQGLNSSGVGSPQIEFYTYKTDADTISDNDRLAQLNFYGLNSNNDMTIFAYMYGNRETIADGNESGEFKFKLQADGNLEEKFSINKNGIKLITDNTTVTSGDSFGSLEWQAPLESSGGKAQDVTAKIEAKSFTTFTDTSNRSYLEFHVHEGYGTSDSLTKVATLNEFGRFTLHDSIDTSNGANSDPHFIFERTGTTNGAEIGTIFWKADLSTSNGYNYAEIQAKIVDSDIAQRDGSLHFKVSGDGSSASDVLKLERNTATVTANLSVSADTDATTTLGRSLIHSPTTDNAVFSHVDRTTINNYALLANSTSTYINAPSGNSIFFNNNNGNVASINSGGLKINTGKTILFEGATDDEFETTLTVEDPTLSDKTITLPNATGTVALATPNILAGNLLLNTTISDVATVEVGSTYITDDYDYYDVLLYDIIPETDARYLMCRLGVGGSVSSGGSDYSYGIYQNGAKSTDNVQYASNFDGTSTGILLTVSFDIGELGNGTGEALFGHYRFYNLRSTTFYKRLAHIDSFHFSANEYHTTTRNGLSYGAYNINRESKVDTIQFLMESGNLTSGTMSVYGWKK